MMVESRSLHRLVMHVIVLDALGISVERRPAVFPVALVLHDVAGTKSRHELDSAVS
jgi:hypothetical protein